VKLRLGIAARAAHRVPSGDADAAARATEAIETALRDADQAIDELRDLVHGIYPSALDSDGLAAALLAQARLAPLPVRVRDELTQRYPRDIEAAAYFCCLEALQNAVKHAAATRVEIRLCGGPDRLEFAVTDDGSGIPPGTGTGDGRGLVNLADRAAALGGRITVTSRPGAGTTVTGWLPSQ
jgi:signal transduction histidine kinase